MTPVLADTETSPVTKNIKFSYSYNGVPVIAQTDVNIDWFDLAPYNLDQFNRCEAAPFEEGGAYINDTVIEEPTVLHSLIRMHEAAADDGLNDFECSGSATSMFITKLFGHSTYNLMYYVDHSYPLMGPGWGATADYILLEDGMNVDFAIFDNMDFWTSGAFMYFDQDDYYVTPNDTCTFTVYGAPTYTVEDGNTAPTVTEGGVKVSLLEVSGEQYNNFVTVWNDNMTTEDDGTVTIDFSKIELNTNKEYVLMATDPEAGTDAANRAPAFATINFEGDTIDLTGVSLDVPANTTLHAQETYQLEPIITDTNATNVSITYTSSNEDVATVSPSGLVTAKTVSSPSDVTITCTATQGSITKTATATFRVLVGTSVSNVTLDHHYMEIPNTQLTGTLTATSTPADSFTVINWTPWQSGTSNVALVGYASGQSNVGIVHPIGVGVETVRATAQADSSVFDECRVAVGGKFGDADGDNDVNMNDVNLALNMVGSTSGDRFAFIDIDGDGTITDKDSDIILSIVLGQTEVYVVTE